MKQKAKRIEKELAKQDKCKTIGERMSKNQDDNDTTLTFRLPKRLKQKVIGVAKAHKISVSKMVRGSIKQTLNIK